MINTCKCTQNMVTFIFNAEKKNFQKRSNSGFLEVRTHAALLLQVKPTLGLGLFARQPRAKAHAAV